MSTGGNWTLTLPSRPSASGNPMGEAMSNFQPRILVWLAAITLSLTACSGGDGSPPPLPQPDFAIAVAPASLSAVNGGASGSATVSVTAANGRLDQRVDRQTDRRGMNQCAACRA